MARRPWGQHFLQDQRIIHKIIRALEIQEHETILEIGPGRGALTFSLAKSTANLVAVEIDKKMIDKLEAQRDRLESVEIIHQDFLKMSWQDLCSSTGENFKVVSNLPYQSSTAILLKLFHEIQFPTRFVFMFQREVAERLLARPGTRTYGRLTVITQIFAKVKKVCEVSTQAFYPPPEVESRVLQFDLYPKPLINREDLLSFEAFLSQAFQHKRKLLRNNLSASYFQLTREELDHILIQKLHSLKVRAEEIPLDQWVDLFYQLK